MERQGANFLTPPKQHPYETRCYIRDPDPDDGRGVIVRYTERGRAVLAIARRRMLALERSYAAQVGADRWAEVRSTLETLFGDDLTRT